MHARPAAMQVACSMADRQAGLQAKTILLLVSCDNFALRTGILEWSFERMICFRRSALASATTKPSEQERN